MAKSTVITLHDLVKAALEREQYLSTCTKRDQGAVKKLNNIYVEIHRVKSGGRKTPRKVALLEGASYVRHIARGE